MGQSSDTDHEILEYAAPGIVVTWEPGRCQHAAECVGGLPAVFNVKSHPWISPTAASVDELVATIDKCPSHALGYRTDDGRQRVAPSQA